MALSLPEVGLIFPSIWLFMELTNVIAMYFVPGTQLANAVGIFKGWEKSQKDPEIHDFVRYLVFWVAGTKVIFISLLTTVLVLGDDRVKGVSLLVLTGAIATFYWKLFPLIWKLDNKGEVQPRHYSKVIGAMILFFMIGLVLSALAFLIPA